MAQNLEGLKVAIVVAKGFEQVELTEPKKALESAGAQTRIVSPVKDQVQGWNHFEKDVLSAQQTVRTFERRGVCALNILRAPPVHPSVTLSSRAISIRP